MGGTTHGETLLELRLGQSQGVPALGELRPQVPDLSTPRTQAVGEVAEGSGEATHRVDRMANLVYKRVSTDEQSTARQNLVLAEAGIEDPKEFVEEVGTSSRLHPLKRSKFAALLEYARTGDTIHISEMFRLVRGTQQILDVLDVLHERGVYLKIHDGAFSAMDLTARHERTGELLATVKFLVQTLAAAGELQRDLQRELTYDGLRAAEAKGNKGGRRPAVAAAQIGDVRTAYLEGRSIAALARDHGVSRGAIRTAVADLLPDHTATEEDAPAPELPVALDMPGKVADYLRTTELEPVERVALDRGTTVRRGQGYTLRVTAVPAVHHQLLARCQPLDGAQGIPPVPAQRKARREYENRVSALTP
ncbi:recombinase family protein [Streptomyces virginiae]|uniref:recombinase family protein n=1 Tax=Streptomyces virginiae TaxID=1961 RepID=UPI0036C85EA9